MLAGQLPFPSVRASSTLNPAAASIPSLLIASLDWSSALLLAAASAHRTPLIPAGIQLPISVAHNRQPDFFLAPLPAFLIHQDEDQPGQIHTFDQERNRKPAAVIDLPFQPPSERFFPPGEKCPRPPGSKSQGRRPFGRENKTSGLHPGTPPEKRGWQQGQGCPTRGPAA